MPVGVPLFCSVTVPAMGRTVLLCGLSETVFPDTQYEYFKTVGELGSSGDVLSVVSELPDTAYPPVVEALADGAAIPPL